MAGITIRNHKLTPDQYLKLFSNPVSGIACEIDPNMIPFENEHSFGIKKEELSLDYLKNIRYSKSMILNALKFWHGNITRYSERIYKIYNPLIDINNQIWKHMGEIAQMYNMIKDEYPNTFLFSHRHIHSKTTKHSKSMDIQLKLLYDKYPDLFRKCRFYGFQEGTLQPLFNFAILNDSIIFSVFPNEHPYITRDKISRVGMTEKGNVFIMMDNGANKK